MHTPITQSKKYLKELKDFTAAVESIIDPVSKIKATKLLNEFKIQASSIDRLYDSILEGHRTNANPKEFAVRLIAARKELYKIVNDLKS